MGVQVAILVLSWLASRPVSATPDSWQCDVRAWTRAPDLYPGAALPAEARLALNGSECGDVKTWTVGLRLRERATIKKRAKSAVSLPHRPVSPSRCSNSSCLFPQNDRNDIYSPTDAWFWPYEGKDSKYLEAVREYQTLIRNESLWDVHSVERVVFDVQQQLPFEPAADGAPDIDVVEPFHVHVPLTNFPPMDVYDASFRHHGSDQQVFATETQFEYYHNITLVDGSIQIIPAGKSGFIPSNTASSGIHDAQSSWPQSTDLKSPHNYTADLDDPKDGLIRHRPKPPECDDGNAATFHISLEPDSPPVQGHNIAFSVTLTRRGNGSEYPQFIDIKPFHEHEMQWARTFFDTDDAYEAFLNPKEMHYSSRGSKMLLVKPMSVLEEDRARKEEDEMARRLRRAERITYFGDGKNAVARDTARYDFEERGEGEKDEYRFSLELPIPYDAMPSFARTFDDLHSVLDIKVHTAFTCQEDLASDLTIGPDLVNTVTDSLAKDADWTEYELAPRSPKVPRLKRRYFSHDSRIPLEVAVASSHALPGIKSYNDPSARAPCLSLGPRVAPYKLVNHVWRDEKPEERLISRYGNNDHSRRQGRCKPGVYSDECRNLNGGGGGMHAAKLWQRVEMSRTGKEDHGKGFVIQG